jgi:hypothetical protein
MATDTPQKFITENHPAVSPVVGALPASGDFTGQKKWYASRGREYYWNGTYWLSSQEYVLALPSRSSQTYAEATTAWDAYIPDYDQNGFLIQQLVFGFRSETSGQSAINYYNIQLRTLDAGTKTFGSFFTPTSGPTNTQAYTTLSANESGKQVYNQACNSSQSAIQLVLTPSGAPGTFRAWGTVKYRLIG